MMSLIHRAAAFAAVAHANQKRKGSETPYIAHPCEVGILLKGEGAEDEVVAAGLLHDTLEDTAVTREELVQSFGPRVAALVEACSEKKGDPWQKRKTHTIEVLEAGCSYEVMLIVCADKLSNMRSIAEDLAVLGEALWERFFRGRAEQGWYYRSLVEALRPLEDLEMYQELSGLVADVFDKEKKG